MYLINSEIMSCILYKLKDYMSCLSVYNRLPEYYSEKEQYMDYEIKPDQKIQMDLGIFITENTIIGPIKCIRSNISVRNWNGTPYPEITSIEMANQFLRDQSKGYNLKYTE